MPERFNSLLCISRLLHGRPVKGRPKNASTRGAEVLGREKREPAAPLLPPPVRTATACPGQTSNDCSLGLSICDITRSLDQPVQGLGIELFGGVRILRHAFLAGQLARARRQLLDRMPQ